MRFYIYDAVIFNSTRKVFFRDSRFYENSTAIWPLVLRRQDINYAKITDLIQQEKVS